MAEIRVLEIEQNNPDYLMCKLCRTHITTREELQFIFWEVEGEEVKDMGVFDVVINVRVDKFTNYRRHNRFLVADVFCYPCGENLGWKYVYVSGGTEQLTVGARVFTLQKGMVKLKLEKLLWVHGARTRPGEELPFPPPA